MKPVVFVFIELILFVLTPFSSASDGCKFDLARIGLAPNGNLLVPAKAQDPSKLFRLNLRGPNVTRLMFTGVRVSSFTMSGDRRLIALELHGSTNLHLVELKESPVATTEQPARSELKPYNTGSSLTRPVFLRDGSFLRYQVTQGPKHELNIKFIEFKNIAETSREISLYRELRNIGFALNLLTRAYPLSDNFYYVVGISKYAPKYKVEAIVEYYPEMPNAKPVIKAQHVISEGNSEGWFQNGFFQRWNADNILGVIPRGTDGKVFDVLIQDDTGGKQLRFTEGAIEPEVISPSAYFNRSDGFTVAKIENSSAGMLLVNSPQVKRDPLKIKMVEGYGNSKWTVEDYSREYKLYRMSSGFFLKYVNNKGMGVVAILIPEMKNSKAKLVNPSLVRALSVQGDDVFMLRGEEGLDKPQFLLNPRF